MSVCCKVLQRRIEESIFFKINAILVEPHVWPVIAILLLSSSHRHYQVPPPGTNSYQRSERPPPLNLEQRQESDGGGLRGIDLAAVEARDRKADVSRERL